MRQRQESVHAPDGSLEAERRMCGEIPQSSYCCISIWADGTVRIRGTEEDVRELKAWFEEQFRTRWDYFSLCG